MGRYLEIAIGALNGAVGDYLTRTKNGLATPMQCILDDAVVPLERKAFAQAYPAPSARVVVLLHGLMCTEDIWRFPAEEEMEPVGASDAVMPARARDYGEMLARDFGFTPVYLRYNSGRAIADNGEELARLLDALVAAYPVAIEEIIPLGYSMGGLIVRSACHVAHERELAWLQLVKRALYVGTPHRGAPMERAGRVLAKVLGSIEDPYTQLIADLANLRSDGVKDLGDADLRHEDRARPSERLSLRDPHHPVPLLPTVSHYLVAGSLAEDPRLALLFGDLMVTIRSATNDHARCADTLMFPPDHVKILAGLAHVPLAHHPRVYEALRGFLETP